MTLEDDVIGIGFRTVVNTYFAKVTDDTSNRYHNALSLKSAILGRYRFEDSRDVYPMVIPRELME